MFYAYRPPKSTTRFNNQSTTRVNNQSTTRVNNQSTTNQQPVKSQSQQPESTTRVNNQSTTRVNNQSQQPVNNQSQQPESTASQLPESTTRVNNQSQQPVKDQSTASQQPVNNQSQQPVNNQSQQPESTISQQPVNRQSTDRVNNQSLQSVNNQSQQPVNNQSKQPVNNQSTTRVNNQSQQPESTTIVNNQSQQPESTTVNNQSTTSQQPVNNQSTTSQQPVNNQSQQPESTTSQRPVNDQSQQPESTTSQQPVNDQNQQPESTTTKQAVNDQSTTRVNNQSTTSQQPVNNQSTTRVNNQSTTRVNNQSTTSQRPESTTSQRPVNDQSKQPVNSQSTTSQRPVNDQSTTSQQPTTHYVNTSTLSNEHKATMMLLPVFMLVALCCIPGSEGSQGDEVKLCRQRKEVVFLLDGSRSVSKNHFDNNVKNFTKSMVGLFNVGPQDTRISVVTFSAEVKEPIPFYSYESVEELQRLIDNNVTFLDQTLTNTHLGLQLARESIFSSDHDGVTQIIICLTDGRPQATSRVKEEIEKIRDLGIYVIAIGVGGDSESGLKLIATNSSDNYIYNVDQFDELHTLMDALSLQLCYVPEPDPLPDASECQDKKMELVFVLDRSTSMGLENFQKIINATKSIVRSLDIGPNATQVATLVFSTDVTLMFSLNHYSEKSEILERLDRIQFPGQGGGESNTHMALSWAKTILAGNHQDDLGVRQIPANHVVVLFTDGHATNVRGTRRAAQALKLLGVYVIAVGVGSEVMGNELTKIASYSSNPTEQYVYQLENYDALESIHDIVDRTACTPAANN
ncbi:hypothetical protein ACOMHN_050246 [Nucella lapillus]